MKINKAKRSVKVELFFIFFLGYIAISVIVLGCIIFSLIIYEVICGQRIYNSNFVKLENNLVSDYKVITENDLKEINGFLVRIDNNNNITYSKGTVIEEFKNVNMTTYMKIFGVTDNNSLLLNSDLRSSSAFRGLNNSIVKTTKDIDYSIYSLYVESDKSILIIGCPYSEVTKPNRITRIIPQHLIIKVLSLANVMIILFMVYILAQITSKYFVKPIKTLLDGVIAIANGDYNVRIKSDRKNEFDELSSGFNKMAETIQNGTKERERLEKMKEELILDISHDLKNPLASILGYSETLLNSDSVTEDEKRECLEIINRNSTKANKLIMDLFEFSLYDNYTYKLNLIKIDICECLRNIIANYISEFEYKEFSYEFNISEDPIYVMLDEQKFTRAINNILDNKIKYNKNGNKVFINTEVSENYIIIDFGDNGDKMPDEYKERIFNPFVRVDKSRNSKTGGTGLGLSITKKIISKHNGVVEIPNTDEGTVFRIKIPIAY